MVSTKEAFEEEKWMETDNLYGKIKRSLEDVLKMGIYMELEKFHSQMVKKPKESG